MLGQLEIRTESRFNPTLSSVKPVLALQDVRYWKDRLLYQIRRFRELVGRSLHLGAAAFTEDSIPDDVERDARFGIQNSRRLAGLELAEVVAYRFGLVQTRLQRGPSS